MSSRVKNKRALLFVIVLAIMPLLFGNALHPLILGAADHGPCCSHDEEHENTSPSTSEDSCFVCHFLAMPSDVTCPVTWDCVLDLVERHQPEPVRPVVDLYRQFQPGRSPPVAV